ncbi:pilus assembly protein [Microbulbifer sp. SA54]
MKINKYFSVRRIRNVLSVFFTVFSTAISAETAPGPISSVPLAMQGGAKPNLMIMLDSSGSMGTNVPDTDPVQTRSQVMKAAAQNLINSLDDESMRVGVARFNGGNGATILHNLSLLSASEKTAINSIIGDIPASGVTPLAEAASDIGRYFTYGYASDRNLELHPGNSFNVQAEFKPVSDIFKRNPSFANSLDTTPEVVQYYCQKNFFMLLTDGEPNGDFNVSDVLKDYDGDCLSQDGDPLEDDNSCRTHLGGDGSDYLDDVTTAMYDMDLRPDLDGPDASAPVKNNVSTYMVGFAEASLANNPLMSSAASQAGGQYLYASDGQALQAAFRSILTDIFSKVSSSSSASFSATSLNNGANVFLARFNSESWSGDLVARTISSEGEISESDLWSARNQFPAPANRLILTSVDGVGEGFTNGLIGRATETAQEADLNINTGAVTPNDGGATDRLAYLRGSRAKEGDAATDYRRRDGLLGDIVHSTPTYVGAPSIVNAGYEAYGDGDYSAFVDDNASRTGVVYVGANDGMLHGFNADTGEELIAYAPESLFSPESTEGLHYLTSQDYAHRYYVDLTPTVAEAYFDDEWHSVLIGGYGGGGKGYFFLDVTDPDDFTLNNASSIVLGELNADSDDDLGLSYSRPKVARLNNGRWAVIFGNGYNSVNGEAVLYLYYLDDGSLQKIHTGVGTTDEKNGLSTPSLADLNGDGIVDWVYAGDVQGNMWSFDLCNRQDETLCDSGDNADAGWGLAYGSGNPLFTTGTANAREPITTAPRIARNTDNTVAANGGFPNLLVFFGSGQYLNTTDLQDTQGTAYYAVWDKGSFNLDSENLAIRTLGVERGLRTIDGLPVNWSADYGWKIELADGSAGVTSTVGGERVIVESHLMGSVAFFNTAIPSTATCSSGGTGWLMSVDLFSGLAPKIPVFDANNDGEIDSTDLGYVGEMPSDLNNNSGTSNGGSEEGLLDSGTFITRDGGAISGEGKFCINLNGNLVCTDRQWSADSLQGRLSWEELVRY